MSLRVVTISWSEIAGIVLTNKLKPLQAEALGGIRFINMDVRDLRSRIENIKESASLIILNLPSWSTDHVDILEVLRASDYTGPILAVVHDARIWSEGILSAVSLNKVTFLQKPYADSDLIGLTRRLLADQAVTSREFPRYEMNQEAELLIGSDNLAHMCTLRNVSRGGACIEFQAGTLPIERGENATLRVRLGDGANPQAVRGRVVWVQPYKALVGMEFMHAFAA